MKKWITIDAFIVAFFSAMGYAFGYSIPSQLNVPVWLCFVICFAGGMAMEEIGGKIIYSRFTQEKVWRKLLVFAAFIVIFFIGNFISSKFLEESLIEGLGEEWGFVILFAVLGLVTSFVKQYTMTVKAKKRYGSGEEGFRFNEKEKAYIEGMNGKNTEITGEYDSDLAAKTRTGIFVGEKEGGIFSFKGIPYAKAPVGPLRWKAPEKLPDSNKVFEAKCFGASSIQVNYEGNILSSHQQSEDCLTLNVCTAELDSEEKKPVVVYFHGGEFNYGGSADPLWEMQSFVEAHPDTVAVSFNYRLGLMGFINLSSVPGGEDYPDAGDLGLLDQIAALEWVKENIAAFGGDPEQITAMGDGSGGVSICLLAAQKRVKGLFRKAVILSGALYSIKHMSTVTDELTPQLLKVTGATNMKDLLALSENDLCELSQQLKDYLVNSKLDGKMFRTDVFQEYKNGVANDIEFILCASKDNANVYGATIGRGLFERLISDSVENVLYWQKPEVAEKLRQLLSDETERIGKANAEARFVNLWMDNICMLHLSENLRAGGSSVRLLYWDVDAVVKNLGVGDVSLISTVLGNSDAAESFGSVVSGEITEVMQTLILKFIQGEAPALYNNEVDGVNAIEWKDYPDIFAVSKNKMQLQTPEETMKDAIDLIQLAEL